MLFRTTRKQSPITVHILTGTCVLCFTRNEDLLSILTEVNNDVSKKSDPNRSMRQMPQPIHTLRMGVFFPVPKELPPSL